MNNSSIEQGENIDQAIKLNKEIAQRIASLKRKCFDFKVLGPIELSQRSNGPLVSTHPINNIVNMLKFSLDDQELMIKELSCRLNIQGMTIEQFLTGRIEISQTELVVILINKLKYPNQYTARRTARLIFEMTIFDTQQKRQIDDILFEFKKRLECSSYSRSTGKQLFEKLRLKIRNLFYHKIINRKSIDYHSMSRYLFSEGLDLYEVNQLLSYILERSPASSFHWFELKAVLLKQQQSESNKKDKYQKKESILTKSSDDHDHQPGGQQGAGIQEISFADCEIEVVEPAHEPHRCGVYDCLH